MRAHIKPLLFLVLVSSLVLFLYPLPTVRAAGAIVQTCNNTGSSVTTITCTLSSTVTSANFISISLAFGTVVSSLSCSDNNEGQVFNTFSGAASVTNTGEAAFYYSWAPNTVSSDVISCSWTTSATVLVNGFEASGISYQRIQTGSSTGTSTSVALTSSFASSGGTTLTVCSVYANNPSTYTQAASFTLGTTSTVGANEYSVTASSAFNCSMTLGSSVAWAEVGVQLGLSTGVQSASTTASGTSVGVATTDETNSHDVILVCASSSVSQSSPSISDSLSPATVWTASGSATNTAWAGCWYGRPSVTGSDTVTVSGSSALWGILVQQCLGDTVAGIQDNTGTGTGTSYAVTSVTFSSTNCAAAIVSGAGNIGTPSATSPFVLKSGTGANSLAEFDSLIAATTTTCPATGTTSQSWAEVCVVAPNITQATLTSTSAGTGASISGTNYFSITRTLQGASATDSFNVVGSKTIFRVDPSSTVTISATTSGSTSANRWLIALSGSSPVVTTFSSGTASTVSASQTYREQLSQVYTATCNASCVFPTSGTVTLQGTSLGSFSASSCSIAVGGTSSASCSAGSSWFDYNTLVAMTGFSTMGTSTQQWSSTPLSYSLLGYWPLEEGTGTTTFDLSGSALTGTLSGASPPTWLSSGCHFNTNCLQMNGASSSTSYVNTPVVSFSNASSYTVSGWINPTSYASNTMQTLARQERGCSGANFGGFVISYTSTQLIFAGCTQTDNTLIYTTATFNTGTAYFITATFAPSGTLNNVALYINGVLVKTGTIAFDSLPVSQPFQIGDSFAPDAPNAVFQDVREYSTVLPASEVSELYHQTPVNQIFSDTTGANTHTVTYYSQFADTAQFTLNGGGSPTSPTLTGVALGSTLTSFSAVTTSAHTFWLDAGSSWSTTNPSSNSGGSERWESPSASGTTSSSVVTVINPSYYHQYAQTSSYSGTVASLGAPSLNCVQFGTPTPTLLTNSPVSIWCDNAGAFTITKPTVDFPSSTERYQTLFANGTISSAATVNPVFYHQYSQAAGYTVNCLSFPSNSFAVKPDLSCPSPTLSTTQFGKSTKVIFPLTPVWLDAGSSASASSTLSDPSGDIYSTSSATSWTITASNVVTSVVYSYSSFVSNTSFLLSTTNTYITFNQLVWMQQSQAFGSQVNFTALSAGSPTNTPRTFGVGITGSNASVTCVQNTNVCFSVTKPTSSSLINLYFYYLPSAVPLQVSLTIGAFTYNIPLAQYSQTNTGSLPFVYQNVAGHYLEVEYDPPVSSSITFMYSTSQAVQCTGFQSLMGSSTNSYDLLIIIPLIAIVGIIITALLLSSEGDTEDMWPLILGCVIVIGVIIMIALGLIVIDQFTNAGQNTFGPC